MSKKEHVHEKVPGPLVESQSTIPFTESKASKELCPHCKSSGKCQNLSEADKKFLSVVDNIKKNQDRKVVYPGMTIDDFRKLFGNKK